MDLSPSSICLDDLIPHIKIRRETGIMPREIKNKPSVRDIPLVGVALEAMRHLHHGFDRYRGKGTYSAAANAFIRSITSIMIALIWRQASFQ